MSKKVVLVGHCGADSSFLRMAVSKADKDATVVVAGDADDLKRELADGAPLVLVNRLLDYGYDQNEGAELIAVWRAVNPSARWMMVSNFPDAHEAAVQAGGLAGFGKRDIGTPRVAELLRSVLNAPEPASTDVKTG